ncbi:MAG: hypothetical protein V4484_12080 [Pseudomonadota bacterium]
MDDFLQEMLFCECMLKCESSDCRAFFEFDEVAVEPMDAWAQRAVVEARRIGWTVGHTGLVKCPACSVKPS